MTTRQVLGHKKFKIPEERRNALYDAVFNIFAWDEKRRDMDACICGLPIEYRPKITVLCKELGIDPDEYLAELQSHGVFADVGWEHLLTTKAAHPKSACTPAYVLYHFLYKLCKEKGIRRYHTYEI